MNNYGIITKNGDVIQVESEEIYIDSGSAVFCNWVDDIYGAANRDIIAVYQLDEVQSITKQKTYTEDEILAEIHSKDLQTKTNEILAEEYKQQVMAVKDLQAQEKNNEQA